jgi:amidase
MQSKPDHGLKAQIDSLSRRSFLLGAGVGAAAVLANTVSPAALGACGAEFSSSDLEDLTWLSATRLAELIRTKQVSSVEVVEAHIARIKAVNPKINAVVRLAEEESMKRAGEADQALARGNNWGPLHGVPVTIKDEFETEGIVTTIGTLGLKDHVPTENATVVKRYKAAGAIIMGKTNVPELLWAAETDNFIYGRTNNPYDLERSPNGSSGGEAAIIAAGGSPLGIGSDAGGSIRAPAHFCGIAGLKPTWGRIPLTGSLMPVCPVLSRFDAAGPMARYVEDLSLALSVLAGPDGHDPDASPVCVRSPRNVDLKNLRIAFFARDTLATPTPEIQSMVKRAARVLADAGAHVHEECPPGFENTGNLAVTLLAEDTAFGLRNALKNCKTTKTHPLMLDALKFTARIIDQMGNDRQQILFEAHKQWHRFRSDLCAFFGRYDAILCPPDLTAAWKHGSSLLADDSSIRVEGTTLQVEAADGWEYQVAFNMSGSPAAVVRCGTSRDGMPIAVQVVGRHWREDIALAVASRLERELGGWQPPKL